MSERRIIRVKGEEKPVMTLSILGKYFPEKAPKVEFPTRPPELKSKEEIEKWLGNVTGVVEEKTRELWEQWVKTRETDSRIRIEFMSWAWNGRLIGEGHVKSIDGAFLDEACCLRLPDGRIVHGGTEDLPNDRICANAAILREERESGVSYVNPASEIKNAIKEGMGEHIEEVKAIVARHASPKEQLSRIQNIKKAYDRLRTWSKVAADIIGKVDHERKTGKPNPNENDWLEPEAYRRLIEDLKTNTPKSLVKQLADTLSKAVRRSDEKRKPGKST